MTRVTRQTAVAQEMVLPLSVILLFLLPIGFADAGAVAKSDVCADDGAGLQCPSGRVVHVHTVRCADGSHDCAARILERLFALCEGRASCALLGLREVFSAHCHSPEPRARRLVVSFTCEHGPNPAPACRANLCSAATRVLTCPPRSLLHVHSLSCHSGLDPCSAATFLTLYTLCEGRVECDASGLRMLTPCGQPAPSPGLRNVIVDYVCVPETAVYSKCTGQYQRLTEAFGVLMSPGLAGRGAGGSGSSLQCHWFVSPGDQGRVVHLVVHMAYSKRTASNCSSNFLQVRYKDCQTGESRTRSFCDLQHVNSPLTSCGPVHVSSWLPAAPDQADRFLVSYQIVPKGSGLVTPKGMAECHTTTATPLPPAITTRPTLARRNYGPGGTMFDYSDTIRQTEDSKADDNPGKVTFQFKLVILYVFFGVVILALVIALVYVLISYRGISRRSHHPGDSSEKAALWRNDDTPLDTFNHNSHTSLADANNTSSNHNHHPTTGTAHSPDANHVTGSPDSQVVSCTVHAESTDEESEQRPSRVSSFLGSSKGDPELTELLAKVSPYSTLPHDGPRGGTLPRRWSGESGGSTLASTRSSSFKTNGDLGNIYEAIDGPQFHSLQRPHSSGGRGHAHSPEGEHTPLVQPHPQPPPSPPLPPPPPPIATDYDEEPGSHIDHYTVNNDEYALVKKPRHRSPGKIVSPTRRNAPPLQSPTRRSAEYTNMADTDSPDPTYDSVDFFQDKSGPVVGFRPTSGPYDRDRNSKSEPVSPSSGGTSRHRWDEL